MKLQRKKVPWKDREHLFTPANITKYELSCLKEKVWPSSCNVKMRVKPLPHGQVRHLINKGMRLLLTTEEEFFGDLLMSKGPQLPEDRYGEPNQFYLEEE
jgi:hypothetical protein